MPRYSRAGGQTTWDQRKEVIDACDTIIPPGGRTSYVIWEDNPNERVSRTDKTSFIFGQAEWSEDNLPDIAFVLEPSDEWKAFTESALPQQKKDPQGHLMFEEFSEPGTNRRPLLDFKHLPDKISTAVHWFRPELWRRYDGRIGWEDIMMRMEQPRPNQTALQMRISRGRARFQMAAWHGSLIDNRSISDTRRKIFDGLTAAQIKSNTTRGTTPGLKNPEMGELGGRVPVPSLKSYVRRVRTRARPARQLSATSSLIAYPTPSSSRARISLDRDQLRARLDERDRIIYGGESSNRELSYASKPSAGPGEYYLPYMPVPGLDLMNFVEERFAALDNDGTNISAKRIKNTGSLLASNELPSSSSHQPNFWAALKTAPDFFVGDPKLNAVIDGFYENDVEESPLMSVRNRVKVFETQAAQLPSSRSHFARNTQVEARPSREKSGSSHDFPKSSINRMRSRSSVTSLTPKVSCEVPRGMRVDKRRSFLGSKDRHFNPKAVTIKNVTVEAPVILADNVEDRAKPKAVTTGEVTLDVPGILADNMKDRVENNVGNQGDELMDLSVNDINVDVSQSHAAPDDLRAANVPDIVSPSPQEPNTSARSTRDLRTRTLGTRALETRAPRARSHRIREPRTRASDFTAPASDESVSNRFTRYGVGNSESDFNLEDYFDMEKYQEQD